MAVHIFEASPPHQCILKLYCLVGYEDGSVALYSRGEDATIKTIEGRGWTQLWRRREHVESSRAHKDIQIKT
jgi:ASTRA-associated protein 1